VAESISSDAAGNPALQRYRAREDQILVHALLTRQFDEVRQHTPGVINYLYRTTGTTLLALLFSFLILFDLRRLTRHVQEIGTSRLRDFYAEAAEPVVRFGQLLGHAIQAQAAIAPHSSGAGPARAVDAGSPLMPSRIPSAKSGSMSP